MEKRGVVEPGRTPTEDETVTKEARSIEGTLDDYKKQFGDKVGDTIFKCDEELVKRLDEDHPTRRAIKQANEPPAKGC